MSNSVPPHRWQPTRLPRPWDSPGKNTGVGCHFLLQCMKVKSESEVVQSYPTLSDPMDYSLPGSSVHGIFPGKSTGVGCHCLLLLLLFSECPTLATPWFVACQAPLSMGFLRQKDWSGLSFPYPEDFPDPRSEPLSPALQVDSSLLSHQGNPK